MIHINKIVHNIKNEYKRTNSQDFELPKDMKENLNIVFIGHVDAGKSTMGGQILYVFEKYINEYINLVFILFYFIYLFQNY